MKDVEKISSDKVEITYTSRQIYKFDRKMSYPLKENDKIVVLNVAMNVSIMKRLFYFDLINSSFFYDII